MTGLTEIVTDIEALITNSTSNLITSIASDVQMIGTILEKIVPSTISIDIKLD